MADTLKGSLLPEQDRQEKDAQHASQYLTFVIAEEEYGVDILCVQEIRGWEKATALPNAPDHVKGVINLRGTIVPLVDLRECFGLPVVEYGALTVVIVLKVETQNGERVVGIIVDAVSDVHTVNADELRPAPEMGDSQNMNYILGLVNVDDKMVILLDMGKMLILDDVSEQTLQDTKLLHQAVTQASHSCDGGESNRCDDGDKTS